MKKRHSFITTYDSKLSQSTTNFKHKIKNFKSHIMELIKVKCTNCGESIQLDSDREEGFCSYCGNKVKIKEAISKVKIDNTEELSNLYQIARRAKEQDNSQNAANFYEMIIIKDPNSWEANFYVVYYKAMQCKIAEIWSAAKSVNNNIKMVFTLIKDHVNEDYDRAIAINEVCFKLDSIATMLYNAAKSHYDGIDYSIKTKFVQQYVDNVAEATQIQYTLGDTLVKIFGDKYGKQAAIAWTSAIKMHSGYIKQLIEKENNKNIINKYVEKIKKYNPDFKAPYIDTSGCYIATAVYGSYDAPQVMILRSYRDEVLTKSILGRAFIIIYYKLSPRVACWLRNADPFNRWIRSILDKWVKHLST